MLLCVTGVGQEDIDSEAKNFVRQQGYREQSSEESDSDALMIGKYNLQITIASC